ncbi:hypothetical protein [Streptomyces sp. cmx-4-25]|uniref:hypothetical protein n=1 Tax=unclassified Streptomyces TaxID=2593676 RepID=UPI00397EC7A8
MGEGRERRVPRAELSGAVGTALVAAAAVAGLGAVAGLPVWAVVAGALITAGFAGRAGASAGRRRGIRHEALDPGETVIGTYTVRPPYTAHTPPAAHEGPQYQLLTTTRGLQLWERSALLWRYPWPEVRVIAEGPRLRVHRGGNEAGTMLLEQPGAALEIRRVAARHGAV